MKITHTHAGPCLNWPGQDPADYTEHDSCYRHLEAPAVIEAETFDDRTQLLEAVRVFDSKVTVAHFAHPDR